MIPRDARGRGAGSGNAGGNGGAVAAPVRDAAPDRARFRGVADQAPVVLWTTDATGACDYLNGAWYAYTGQSEAKGLGWLDAVHPDDKAEAERAFLAADAARKPFQLEHRLRRADGTYRWAINLATPRFAADGGFLGFVGSVIDIHLRREAEERLRESEANARLAIEAGRLGTWSFEPGTGALEWDARCGALFGRPPGSAATLEDVLRACHPGDRARVEAALAAALDDPARTGAIAEEFRVSGAADGGGRGERWVAIAGRGCFDDAGRCAGLVGVAVEVSDHRRAETVLRERNEMLERDVEDRTRDRDCIWHKSRDLLLVVGAHGVIQAANPAWTATLGYGPEELVGRHFTHFVLPEDADGSRVAMEQAAAEGGLPHFENRYRHRDGSVRWFSWTAAREGGSLYCVARDVTADKAREAELEAAQEQLRQAQKMEAVGQLTGGIAHDFNNLLQVVIGNLEILQRNLPEDAARLHRSAENAMNGARRAAALTARLLAFSRRQPLAPRPVDANGLVAGMSELLGRTLGEAVRIETALADGLWRAEADPNQLENAILNLAVNARDAMPDGGALTIETANARLDRAYAARNAGAKPGQYVMIAVSDTGSGMTRGRWTGCSSRSSPRKRSARAPASAFPRSTASSSSRAGT
jgi:PAS domain S-box-containing protein